MAYQGPAYGLSLECQLKAQAKFDKIRASQALEWIQQITGANVCPEDSEQITEAKFADALKDGITLCQLLNTLQPGIVSRVNTMSAPFKQRENLEFFLKGCSKYGLKQEDTFQGNDLYESKNLYQVVDCIHAIGGLAQKKGFSGPQLGVRVAREQPRNFPNEVMNAGQTVVGLQYGTNKCASQKGMTAYGATRQILPNAK